jgi:hypothetical protein
VQAKSGGDTPLPPKNDEKDPKEGGYPLPPETNARLHALYAPDENGIVRFDV